MSILQHDLVPGYPILTVDHPLVKARVALHGAHLLEWTPVGHPVLYLSPDAIYRNGKAVRGGIPICWPWFGPHPTRPELPAHGLARTRAWELADAEEDADGVTLRFNLPDDDDTRKLWPEPFALELTMRLGSKLEMSLLMENHAHHPITISSALHTYLAVGDIRQIFLTGLEGANYLDEVGQPTERTQAGEIRFASEVDRIYAAAPAVTVHDPVFERRLRITPTGSGSTVVWNPWIEKSRKLTDLPDDDYQRFVCVETTNAWQDLVKLEPGDCHTLGMTLEVI